MLSSLFRQMYLLDSLGYSHDKELQQIQRFFRVEALVRQKVRLLGRFRQYQAKVCQKNFIDGLFFDITPGNPANKLH